MAGTLLCNALAFGLFGLLVPVFLPMAPRLWDYIATVALLHVVLSCLGASPGPGNAGADANHWAGHAVSVAFPTTWSWWVMLLVATAGAMVLAHIVRRFVMDLPAAPGESRPRP